MPESLPDDQTTIERVLLWDDINDAFRSNAFVLGAQISSDNPDSATARPTRLVLEAEPDEEHTLQLWGQVGKDSMIETATLAYRDKNYAEVKSYELTPASIVQYSRNKIPLDREHLEEIRGDVAEARWSEEASQKCARELLFFS